MPFSSLAEKSLSDAALSRDEARSILAASEAELPDLLSAARRVRETYFGRRVKLCVLLNAQSGICPEDCGYCSQSRISKAKVEKYKLLPEEIIFGQAQKAASSGATRFCMVIAARGPQDRDIEHLSNAVRRIKSDPKTQNLEICTSLGLMDLEKCQKLKGGGRGLCEPQSQHFRAPLRRDLHLPHLRRPRGNVGKRPPGRTQDLQRRHRRHGRNARGYSGFSLLTARKKRRKHPD